MSESREPNLPQRKSTKEVHMKPKALPAPSTATSLTLGNYVHQIQLGHVRMSRG